jgi:CRISPR/Cas system-associated endoribonuclease Cas2
MTGNAGTKQRVIVSERLISPISCCKDFNKKALTFKQSINASVALPRLMADIAVKALDVADGSRKPTYEDTDNRKREFTGDSRPGVESDDLGYRWERAGTWAKDKKLVLSPSYESLNSIGTAPNFGWVENENPRADSFEDMLDRRRRKPHIQLTKYKVDPKTDDIIPSSAKIVDPFAITAGLTAEERARSLGKEKKGQETKRLPGQPLSSRVPGGSLIARAAAAFGVLRDENNKFRCPPGTPSANQFTDMMGSNCFGFSASKFARFAARQAAKIEQEGGMTGLRNSARSFFDFVYKDRIGGDVAEGNIARMARSPWWDAMSGDMFEPPDWRRVPAPDSMRTFVNGNIRAMDDLARQDAAMAELYDELGIDINDEERAFKALGALRKQYLDTEGRSGWDLQIVDTSRRGDKDSARLSPEEVNRYITARLESIPQWRNISLEEQQRMIDADVKRYYLTERAFMEGMLDQFMKDPERMRFVGRLEYNFFSGDEAGSAVYGGKGAPLRGVIHFNPEVIMSNQESMLPDMRPDERLSIAAIGAVTDAEAKTAVADFMVNSTYAARHMAGLVDGPRSFTRHIAIHEISHAFQEMAFIERIQNEIEDKGFIEVPIYDKKSKTLIGTRKVNAIESLTGSDIMSIMTDVADDINLDAMNEAMSRIEVVSNLAGSYPGQFKKGGEVWALEAAAELYALREQGIIYGEDIDAALEWMDNISFGRSSIARGLGDLEAADDADSGTYDMPDGTSIDTPEDIAAEVEDIRARAAAEKREAIKAFKEGFPKLPEDEMFSDAAVIAAQRDFHINEAERIQNSISELPIDSPEIDGLRKSMSDAEENAEFYGILYDEAKNAWRKKYGIGGRGESKRFDDEIQAIREREGLLEPEEIARLARFAELDDIRESASKMDDKKLIRAIADKEIMMKTMEPGSEELQKAAEELEVLRDQYVVNKINSGDTRTSGQIKKELNSEVTNIVNPPPRKVKKFKDSSEVKDHARKERARLSRKTSLVQREALEELGDPEDSELLSMFDPAVQTVVGRGINRRNARLKRLGLEIDPSSAEEGSLAEQVENILIPAMEAIDESSILDPFEMESIIELDGDALKGKIIGKEVEVEHFVSGKISRRGIKKTEVPDGGKKNKTTGKKKHRVIVSVREGDRGHFPKAAEDDQKFVAPPGKLRIIGRDKDGTIRAEISYQKDSVEVVDSMAESLEKNAGDKIWREGASRRVQAVADRYVNRRRTEGVVGPGPRSDDEKTIADTSAEVVGEIVDAGGSFGEAPISFPDSDGPSERLSSGRDVFGPVQTRAERTDSRNKKTSSNLREVKLALGGRGSKEFPEMTRDQIDPEVARLILDTPDEKIVEKLEKTAYELHSGFDRRVRVRMRQDDIEELSRTGKVRSALSSGAEDDGLSRRTRRLAGMAPEQREARLSSGIIESAETLAQRRKAEEEIATKAVDTFNKIISAGKNVNDMDDEELTKIFAGRVKRSTQKSVSAKDKNLYEVEDVDTAIAMMMLGHHVSVKSEDIRLTEQAQKVFESKIKEEAEKLVETNHPKWIEFQNSFSSENPDVDTSLPEVQKRMKSEFIDGHQADLCALYDPTKNLMCSGHIGIDREKMPQTNGRTVGHRTLAIRMLKDGKAAGKWEAKRGVTAPSPIQEIYKTDIDTENAKRVENGEQPMSESEVGAFIYKKIGKKHSLEAELSGKTSQDNRSTYESISPEEKDWFYESTNWQNVEVNLEKPFIDFLNGRIEVSDPENGSSVRLRKVNPAEYAPSQQQLVASKVDGMAQGIQEAAIKISSQIEKSGIKRGTPEFKKAYEEEMAKQWFSSPILTTKDKFILDGHHRWAGIVVANRSLPEELRIELSANEVQTDIVEGLTLGKVFQEVWGIKEARLGAEIPWEQGDVTPIPDDEVAENSRRLIEEAPQMIDDLYERGDYIQIGSIGLKNNPDYAQAVTERRNTALTRRPSRMAQQRERELSDRIARSQGGAARLSSGAETGQGRTTGKLRRLLDTNKPKTSSREDTALSSGKTVNAANNELSREYFSRIGIPGEVSDENMPISGYLVHKSHTEEKRTAISEGKSGSLLPGAVFEIGDNDPIGDGLTAFGDIEIVLKPGVSNRTAYGRGNAIESGHRPVLLNSRNRNDVTDAILSSHGKNSKTEDLEAMMALLSAGIDGNMAKVNSGRSGDGKMPGSQKLSSETPRKPFEAQILGGFDIDEVEQVNYPFTRLREESADVKIDDIVNEKTIAEKLRSSGFTQEEIEYFYSIGGGKLNTQSMQMLRNYRKAQQIKEEYAKKGFNNVKIAHPEGLDIENPLTHGKGAKINEKAEDVLKRNIAREIVEQAEKLLKEMRNPSVPTVVTKRGARL